MKKIVSLLFIFTFLSALIYAQNKAHTSNAIVKKSNTTTVKTSETMIFIDTTKKITNPATPNPKPENSSQYWYNLWSTQKFKKATYQRDSLYRLVLLLTREVILLRRDTTQLKRDTTLKADTIRLLKSINTNERNRFTTLSKEHSTLKTTSANTTSQLTGTIDQKNKQLLEREQQVNDMANALAQREAKIIALENQLKRQDSLANALNDALKKALINFESDDLTLEMKNGKVYISLFDKLLFKSGKADVEAPGKEALKKLAVVLNRTNSIDIMVEGHTDNIPINTAKYPDNWSLSADRSLSIIRLLTDSYNVDPRIVIAAAHAEFNPLTSNDTPQGRAKNRRTEIIVTPRLEGLFDMIKGSNFKKQTMTTTKKIATMKKTTTKKKN